MFKSILATAALVAASSALASAASVTITGLSSDYSGTDITYTSSTGYITGSSLFSTVASGSDNYYTASTTLILSVSALNSLTEDTALLIYETAEGTTTAAIGLSVDVSAGALTFYWAGTTVWTGATNISVTYADLDDDSDGYITVTFVGNDPTDGTVLYNGEGDSLGSSSALKARNVEYTTVYVNTDVVTAISVTDGIATSDEVAEAGSDLNDAVVPEPSAFGLLAGIGALALVAARRRRR